MFLMYLNLGKALNPFYFFFASGTMLFITSLLLKFLIRTSKQPSIIVLYFFSFILSLYSNPPGMNYVAVGFIGIGIIFLVITYILKRLNLIGKLVNSTFSEKIVIYWFIYILAASVVTSTSLSALNDLVNLVPIYILGTFFGWMGPEVTYRFVGGIYGPVKALALYVALFFFVIIFYGFLLGDVFQLHHLASNGPDVLGVSYIAVPSMLLSRITLGTINGVNFSTINKITNRQGTQKG